MDPASPSTRGLTLPLGCGSGLVSSSVPWDEFVLGLWEYVQPENEDGGVSEVIEKVPQNLEVKVPEGPVTNLAMLAHLRGLEESNLMYWIFEFGKEEGLMRAIDEMLDRLNFETGSVASEVPWKGDVLQVHLQVSRQPTEKEEFCFFISRTRRIGNSKGAWRIFFGGIVSGFARARLGERCPVVLPTVGTLACGTLKNWQSGGAGHGGLVGGQGRENGW